MNQTGEIGNFVYEKQKDGTFLYKSKEVSVDLKSKKTKKKYKEKPQYKLIEVYENKAKKRFENNIKNLVIEVINILKR